MGTISAAKNGVRKRQIVSEWPWRRQDFSCSIPEAAEERTSAGGRIEGGGLHEEHGFPPGPSFSETHKASFPISANLGAVLA